MTDTTRTSKRLAYVLRHAPDSIGLELGPAGWVDLDALLHALSVHGRTVTEADVRQVLADTAKQRFEVRDGRIRATHGHSVAVDLGLSEQVPPSILFHGTVERFLDAILQQGLRPRGRQAVHLSSDVETARQVGSRRGRPVVFEVAAAAMHEEGHVFHRATDGVWLAPAVPPEHVRQR